MCSCVGGAYGNGDMNLACDFCVAKYKDRIITTCDERGSVICKYARICQVLDNDLYCVQGNLITSRVYKAIQDATSGLKVPVTEKVAKQITRVRSDMAMYTPGTIEIKKSSLVECLRKAGLRGIRMNTLTIEQYNEIKDCADQIWITPHKDVIFLRSLLV